MVGFGDSGFRLGVRRFEGLRRMVLGPEVVLLMVTCCIGTVFRFSCEK